MNQRPNPDELLKRVQTEEASSARGKLKIFFGACAGVGKTYTMLEAARQRKKEGVDIIIGIVETHGRIDTAALVEGLEILPRKNIDYKGVTLHEFDLDAALTRRPAVILVDELAHTNAPGSRHTKRWQDVEELLQAGISVYTTLNVQHWESLNDVVTQITRVEVRETVPDTFLQGAHEMELVDLAPEDLLKRLKEGKVYCGEFAHHAAENFFQPGNLIALRELALRHVAERVDVQMQSFKEGHAIETAWPVAERLLVGISPSPVAPRLIRATSRLATQLRCSWFAVHVETPASLRLPPEKRAQVIDHLRLAEQLGAETVTLTEQNVTEALLTFARSHNITKIVLGKPAGPRWREWLLGSIVSAIARNCKEVDLYVISGVNEKAASRRVKLQPEPTPWNGITWGTAIVVVCTLFSWSLFHWLDQSNLIMIYLLGIAWVAYRFGKIPSLVAAIFSVLAFDFFFVPPYFSFAVADTQYLFTFAVMLGVGFLISELTSHSHQQTQQMRKREERLRMLYKLSRELSETPGAEQLLQTAWKRLEEFYKYPILLITPISDGSLHISAGNAVTFSFDEREHSVAQWVFDHTQMAGAGTDTLSGAKGLYLPLRGAATTVGVLGIRPGDAKSLLDPLQLQLLETFASEIGAALESTKMSEAVGRAEMQLEMLALSSRPPASQPRFSNYLKEQHIVLFPTGLSWENIINRLISSLNLANPAQAFHAIADREKISPTVLGSGLAIPHARIPGLKEIKAAIGISAEGPLHVWVLFLGPAEDPQTHLSFLAHVSTFFQNSAHVEALQKLTTPRSVLDYIKQHELNPSPVC